jgi:NAD(P)-dependent dehydrogenase (short-subunit alcohol dehydrogenase family)
MRSAPGILSPLIESSEQTKAFIGNLVRERVPADRLGQPEEVADAVVFLAGPMSSYMFGQSLVLDGYVLVDLLRERRHEALISDRGYLAQ